MGGATLFYAGLGRFSAPTGRGRMGYYAGQHRARLELVRALQDHGFTLAAIEKYLARLPADASVEDLAVQRAMMTSWKSGGHEIGSRRQLETRAGRRLGPTQLERLEATMGIRPTDDGRFEILP